MAATLPVLICGAGPVGQTAAYTLAHHNIPCMIVERNPTTTIWPKMDMTNIRSMELLKRLGLADDLRKQAVPQHYSFAVLFSTGLGEKGEEITRWDLPSPDELRKKIREQNDGSMPQEPYQRCMQSVFEKWLRAKIEANELIDSFWNTKVLNVEEKSDRVIATLEDQTTKEIRTVEAQYLLGCDGASSITRRSADLGLTGGPLPAANYLVHFKSRDLKRIHKQGQFWHIFFSRDAIIISQDEVDTWTTHLAVPLDFDQSTMPPKEQIYKVLGGQTGPYKIDVDEILVSNVWRPTNAIADRYRSAGGRVFIAGDAAHQNIPTGGYGMNTGLAEAFDIAWKLAMVLKGVGGDKLLDSYEIERRPVAIRNVTRAAEHMGVHLHYRSMVVELGDEAMLGNSDEAKDLKNYFKKYVDETDGENRETGIEMDCRFGDSPVVVTEIGAEEPEWNRRTYFPSTLPGHRAPHVFMADGQTSIFDLLGKEFTVIDFSQDGSISTKVEEVAKSENLPLTRVHLPAEKHVRSIWERDVVLVRPDHIVAWRSSPAVEYDADQLHTILRQVMGTAD